MSNDKEVKSSRLFFSLFYMKLYSFHFRAKGTFAYYREYMWHRSIACIFNCRKLICNVFIVSFENLFASGHITLCDRSISQKAKVHVQN